MNKASTDPSRRPKLWIAIILLVELVVIFIMAEAVAVLFLPPGPRFIHPQMIMEPSKTRIYYHRPNQRAFTIDQRFNTNAMGFRESREVKDKQVGELRILDLGDSLTVGLGVSAENTYAKQLQAALHHYNHKTWVINAGVSCYSTWQEVDLLKEVADRVKPDIVILAFYWNDLYPRPQDTVPLSANQTGDQQDSWLKYLRLLKRSRILLYIGEKWATLSNTIWPSFDWRHRQMILTGSTSPYVEKAYSDVETSIRELAALQKSKNFVPIVLIFPIPSQVTNIDASTTMQQRIGAIAQRVGVRSLDLLPTLQQAHIATPALYIPWDNEHLTARGHQVVAKAVAGYLKNERLLPPSELSRD